ncbi:MAG: hypothetical protein M3O02_01400 [Acidobacteriota bacterium]|nr:hypothetical protein [Acidobacteriota bacterium]
MGEYGTPVLEEQIEQLRKSNQVQRIFCAASCATTLMLALVVWSHPTSASASATDNDGIMHVRGLVVVDAAGHERVRLGAHLPGPLIRGIREKRNGDLSGILLTDATGTERSGYGTEEEGEAFITLDSQHGQEMTLLSNAGGGVNFDISDPKKNEAQITVFPDGPKFKMKKAGEVVTDLPSTTKDADVP